MTTFITHTQPTDDDTVRALAAVRESIPRGDLKAQVVLGGLLATALAVVPQIAAKPPTGASIAVVVIAVVAGIAATVTGGAALWPRTTGLGTVRTVDTELADITTLARTKFRHVRRAYACAAVAILAAITAVALT